VFDAFGQPPDSVLAAADFVTAADDGWATPTPRR
jgi:hypothetical protein